MPYEFREVICPYCQHQFMFHKVECGVRFCDYKDKITGKKIYLADRCPNCGKFVFAIENILECIKEDDPRIREIRFKGIGMKTELETNDGLSHTINDDEDLYDLIIEYAGVDVADYINQRIDELEGEITDLKEELEESINSDVTGSLKDSVFKDELLGIIAKAENIRNELENKVEELEDTLEELDDLIIENE